MSSYNNNFNAAAAEGHQTATCFPLEDRIGQECLIKGHLRFVPDHHQQQQQQQSSAPQSSGRPQAHHFSSNSLPNNLSNMQHQSQFTDDLYPLDPLYQQQQQHQYYPQQQQQWIAADFVPVQRQVPSTRGAYSYQPYPSSSPRISHYVSPTTASPWDYSILDYSSATVNGPYESTFGSLCVGPDSHSTSSTFPSHGLYAPSSAYAINGGYGLYQQPTQQFQQQQQQQQPTCIAPEDLFARMPMTPISPASLEDSSDDRASSPSSADTTSSGSETPLSARSSPTRPGLQIPTVPSLSLSTSSIAPSWTNSSTTTASSSSSLPSPVESLSSASSHDEPAFIPTASLKKSAAANSTLKAKRATRSAAPEPAWVEAVLAEDAKRLQMDVVGSTAGAPRPANRPIAFACVFCRHRKIQCIRPKTEVAPGEKPAPCNQCEKRNRCCEYPPAALNPRIGRRTRPAGGKNED